MIELKKINTFYGLGHILHDLSLTVGEVNEAYAFFRGSSNSSGENSVARQRADRIATSVASLAEPWITPPPESSVERNRSGSASSSSTAICAMRPPALPT